MSQEERYGVRDLCYSGWHRARSTQRFIGIEAAMRLTMCDVDSALWVEYGPENREPLCLIEAAIDVGQPYKSTTVARNLARRANLPCFVVLYTRGADPNPADARFPDITSFRIKRCWPKPEKNWRVITPGEWAHGLLKIRAWSARRLDAEAANDPYYDTPSPSQRIAGARVR